MKDQDFWFLSAQEGLNQLHIFPERISLQARPRAGCAEAMLSLENPAAGAAPLCENESEGNDS